MSDSDSIGKDIVRTAWRHVERIRNSSSVIFITSNKFVGLYPVCALDT